jgi:hypothetical protein
MAAHKFLFLRKNKLLGKSKNNYWVANYDFEIGEAIVYKK